MDVYLLVCFFLKKLILDMSESWMVTVNDFYKRKISKPSAISSKLQWKKLARSTCAEKLVCAGHDKSRGRFLELRLTFCCKMLLGSWLSWFAAPLWLIVYNVTTIYIYTYTCVCVWLIGFLNTHTQTHIYTYIYIYAYRPIHECAPPCGSSHDFSWPGC